MDTPDEPLSAIRSLDLKAVLPGDPAARIRAAVVELNAAVQRGYTEADLHTHLELLIGEPQHGRPGQPTVTCVLYSREDGSGG